MDIFTDFLLATGEADVGGPMGLQNLLTRNEYFVKNLVNGGPGVKLIQGGSSIRGDVMIREVSTYRNYKPNEKQNWTNPQVTEKYTCPWRFSVDEISWTDQELLLNNDTARRYRDDVRIQAFTDMRKKVNMRGVTSLIHGMEDECWTTPNFTEMELAGGRDIQSMALFSNELTNNGLYASYRSAGTLQGIDKTVFDAWDNQRTTYDRAGVTTSGSDTHLFSALDDILMDLKFDMMPSIGAEYSDPDTKPYGIYTQKQGVINFKGALRDNQDWYRHGPDDPKYGAQFDGIPVIRTEALDTAEIYPTAENVAHGVEDTYGIFSNSAGITNAGPRYHLLDFQCVHKIMHDERFFRYLPKKSPTNQVTNHVIPIDSWHNNFVRDLRRQGVVYPSTDIVDA